MSEEAIWRALDEQRDEWRTFWRRAAAAAFGLLAIIAGASWTAAGGYWQVQRQLDAVVAVNDAQQATLDSRSAVIARAADERARSERVEDLVEWLVTATQKIADDANVRLEPLPTGIRGRRDRAARTAREGS